MSSNAEILARGYVVDSVAHDKHELYFSRQEYNSQSINSKKVSFEIVDDDRDVVWSVSFNEPSKLES